MNHRQTIRALFSITDGWITKHVVKYNASGLEIDLANAKVDPVVGGKDDIAFGIVKDFWFVENKTIEGTEARGRRN